VLSNSFGFGGQNVSLLLGRTSATPRVPSSAAPDAGPTEQRSTEQRSTEQRSPEQQGSGT